MSNFGRKRVPHMWPIDRKIPVARSSKSESRNNEITTRGRAQLRRNDNDNQYAAADEVALINNVMMYLVTEIEYDLNSTNIEKLSSRGQITSLFGYLSQPDDFSTSAGLKHCWNKDTTTHASRAEFTELAPAPAAKYTPAQKAKYNAGFAARKGSLSSSNPIGHFSFNIPLSHIFGFAEYKKPYTVKNMLSH